MGTFLTGFGLPDMILELKHCKMSSYGTSIRAHTYVCMYLCTYEHINALKLVSSIEYYVWVMGARERALTFMCFLDVGYAFCVL